MAIFCSAAIDWAATGNMLSGIGTVAGSGAVLYAAYVGRQTFKGWKRQKIEERKIAVAEQILTLAYRLKRAFSGIRSPGMAGHESRACETKLREDGVIDEATPPGVVSLLITAQGTLTRTTHFKPQFDALLDIMPVAKAIFGDDMETWLNVFWTQRSLVMVAAQSLARQGPNQVFRDQEHIDQVLRRRERDEERIWEGGGEDEVDHVANALSASIASMEAVLLPIIRDDDKAS
jgi:hypothetical protein